MGNIAIIPARGGSKRIHRKNIKDFLGKPIIAYSIEAALKSNLFDTVMVSTDDPEIAEVAMNFGAEVPFMRSPKNSDDFATTEDVLLEVLHQYQNSFNLSFQNSCCIYPTAPLMNNNDLEKGYNLLINSNLISVFPVVPFSYPVLRGLKRFDNGLTRMAWPEHENSRSQDLEVIYHDAGQWYWFNSETLQNKKSMFSENSGSIVINELRVQDIDTEIDWELAEIKYKLNLKNEKF